MKTISFVLPVLTVSLFLTDQEQNIITFLGVSSELSWPTSNDSVTLRERYITCGIIMT